MIRRALVIGSTLLALIGVWAAVLLAPTHPDTATASSITVGTPTAEPGGFSVLPADSAAAPQPAGEVTPAAASTTPPPSAPSSTSTSAGPSAATSTSSATPASTPSITTPASSTPSPRPRPVPYLFAPRATAVGAAPTAELRFSDLTLRAGQQLLAAFTMTSPGAIVFDAHTATSSAGSGTYPTAALHACVEFTGEAPCHPVPTPQPGYWSVTAADLAQHHQYRLRILATATSALLAGVHVGWRGPGQLVVSGVRLPGGCQAAVGKGYVAGCGLKYKVLASGPEQFSTTTSTSGLQLSMKNTVTNAKVYSGPLGSPQQLQIPAAGDWSGHLYPTDGTPVSDLTFTMAWH